MQIKIECEDVHGHATCSPAKVSALSKALEEVLMKHGIATANGAWLTIEEG